MTLSLARTATSLLNDTSLSKRTRKLYEGVLLPFVEKYGHCDITDLTRQDVQAYLATLSALSLRTHHLHQTVIHRLFSHAVELGHLSHNPADHIRRRKADPYKGEHQTDEPVRHLSHAQLEFLFKAVQPTPRLRALTSLLYESGARISEALALDTSQIDFALRQFSVVGKGNKRRWCFFGEMTAQALSTYVNGQRHHPHKALFTERGAYRNDIRRLSYATAYRDWREATARYSSLKGVRFHDFRHTFATERANLVPLEVLRALMGHESIQTTLIYQKVTSSVARESALEALAKLSVRR